jgi:hypothetical protein
MLSFEPPRISPLVIDRRRLQAWLSFNASMPLRYVAAPAGAGKTTAAVQYARASDHRVAFLHVPPATSAEGLLRRLASVTGFSGTVDEATLLAQWAGDAPLEIIIDEADNLLPDARVLLARLYHNAPEHVTFLVIGRSRDIVPTARAQARGLLAFANPALLDFDVAETRALAERFGVAGDDAAYAGLVASTYGWSTAVAGALRSAAANRLPVADGLAAWQFAEAPMLGALLNESLADVHPDLALAYRAGLAGDVRCELAQMERFLSAGLPVCGLPGALAFNPFVRVAASAATLSTRAEHEPFADLELFGTFSFRIGGRLVNFARRRDRQIVQFLACRPDGSASRHDVMERFWPDADRQTAAQNLRTACSTIRRAIASVAGAENVGRYFVADATLRLQLDVVKSSARRFEALAAAGFAALDRGELSEAAESFRSALGVYRAPLLAGEPPQPWAQPHAERLERLYRTICERLDALEQPLRSQFHESHSLTA